MVVSWGNPKNGWCQNRLCVKARLGKARDKIGTRTHKMGGFPFSFSLFAPPKYRLELLTDGDYNTNQSGTSPIQVPSANLLPPETGSSEQDARLGQPQSSGCMRYCT